MTREEAIKIVRENMHLSYDEGNIFEALKTLVPELKESEDERIIKTLQEYVKNRNWPLNGPTQDEVLAWLEKQKQSFRQIHDGAIWDSGLRTGIELGKKEQKPDGDDETEVQKAYREGKNAGRKEVFDHPEYYGLQLRRMYDYETGKRNPEWGKEDIEEYRNEAKFNPKPGDNFWVRCKSREDSGLWFEKGDERPAYTIDDGMNGIQYIVCLDKDGKGNAVSYQNKESFLETFEIIEKQ